MSGKPAGCEKSGKLAILRAYKYKGSYVQTNLVRRSVGLSWFLARKLANLILTLSPLSV